MNDTEQQLNLPWYVNNSLDAQQRQDIEQQLADDTELKQADLKQADLKQEIAFLQLIRQQVKLSASTSPGELGWHKLQRQINQAPVKINRGWQGLAIAASVLLMVQGAVIFNLMQPNDSPDDSYVPLSGISTQHVSLQLQFNADVRESDMRQLLLDVHGQILEGPSAQGIYRIKLEQPEQLAQALEQLQASGLVKHVAKD